MNSATRNRRLAVRLALAAVLMIGFGYLLVPLYQTYCKYTGFNGTTTRIDRGTALLQTADVERWVTVQFVATTNRGLPWDFRPEVASVRVHPGETFVAQFIVHNLGGRLIVGQAVPSVTPGQAARYFRKIECFCFSHQPLAPGETRRLPVQFLVAKDLPPEIRTLTLAYTFFEIPNEPATELPASSAI